MKIIFLDFNGPLIPLRAAFLPGQTHPMRRFDPIAVGFLNTIIKRTEAKLVVTSDWSINGRDLVEEILRENGIDPKHLHLDWTTPRKFSSNHGDNIRWWLDRHPEIKQSPPQDYVIFDANYGTNLNLPNFIRTSQVNGLLFEHYQKALKLLGQDPDATSDSLPGY